MALAVRGVAVVGLDGFVVAKQPRSSIRPILLSAHFFSPSTPYCFSFAATVFAGIVGVLSVRIMALAVRSVAVVGLGVVAALEQKSA